MAYINFELAEAGKAEAEARAVSAAVEVCSSLSCNNDRAVCECESFCKVVIRKGRDVGVTIVGAGADELLTPWLMVLRRTKPTL